MTLYVCRQPASDGAIIGLLAINGIFECYTLEPQALAIPAGTYAVLIQPSRRFGQDVPHLIDVPGRSAIEIHPGNTAIDTHGCIVVGQARGVASVLNSRKAFDDLFAVLQSATDPIAITIENPKAA